MRSRLLPLTILTALGLVLAVIVISLALGEREPDLIEIRGGPEVQGLIGGIRQFDSRLGDADAAVKITLFTDVQCRRCADFQASVVDPLISDYVRPGEAQLELRSFPLGLNPVTIGSVATEAAGMQDRQWQFVELFLRNLDQVPDLGVTEEYVEEVAAATPQLDVAEWREAFGDPESNARAQEDVELATELRLSADPALIIEGPSGAETLEGAPALADARAAIEQVR